MQRHPRCLCQWCKATEQEPCPAGKLIEGVVDGIMKGEIVRSRPRRKARGSNSSRVVSGAPQL